MVGAAPRPQASKAHRRQLALARGVPFATVNAQMRAEHAKQVALAAMLGTGPGRFQAPRGFGLRFLPNPPHMAPTAKRWWHDGGKSAVQGERIADARLKRIRKGSRLRYAQIRGGIA